MSVETIQAKTITGGAPEAGRGGAPEARMGRRGPTPEAKPKGDETTAPEAKTLGGSPEARTSGTTTSGEANFAQEAKQSGLVDPEGDKSFAPEARLRPFTGGDIFDKSFAIVAKTKETGPVAKVFPGSGGDLI